MVTSNGNLNNLVDTQKRPRKTWREVLDQSAPLLLPVAHDALTARVIEQAGYPAYQIGGFALVGSRFAYPDIDLAQFGENSAVMRDTIAASSLPVLVDADDAYGDAKNVTRVVQGYEAMGASAIFLEDQQAPKRCGHMAGKKVIPAEAHAGKLRAAVAARHNPQTFIMARTDALAPLGMTRRCAGPSCTCRPAPTGSTSRRWRRSSSWRRWASGCAGPRWRPASWKAAAGRRGWTPGTCTRWATRCCCIPRRSSSG